MDTLDRLESDSIYVIREAYARFDRIAALWSVGKDSTALLWLCRKAFFGRIPFPVIHLDMGRKLPEMYRFRDRLATEWGLDLIVASNAEARRAGVGPETHSALDCCTALKTEALRQVLRERRLEAVLLGIRRDEHGVRAKERYFSPRDEGLGWDYANQPAELWGHYACRADEGRHLRVHPLLHLTELDVRREGIPVSELYFARDGRRYRSLGCAPCCQPVESEAASVEEIIVEIAASREPERAGRTQDKEDAYTMQTLRALGYM